MRKKAAGKQRVETSPRKTGENCLTKSGGRRYNAVYAGGRAETMEPAAARQQVQRQNEWNRRLQGSRLTAESMESADTGMQDLPQKERSCQACKNQISLRL